MKAERERRESILRAEGEKKSAIFWQRVKKSLQYFVQRLKTTAIKEAEGEAEHYRSTDSRCRRYQKN